MIQFGRSARWYNNYDSEVEFCKTHGFDFMQVWYINGKLKHDTLPDPVEKAIFEANFQIIIHALFTIGDYDKYSEDLLRILKFLNHKEVIIHPSMYPLPAEKDSMYKLAESNKIITDRFYDNGITIYIENNSALDPFNYSPEDLKLVFDYSPKTELLLDIAHIDSYEHLQKIIEVKYPQILHVSDKHFSIGHEHLPIGKGNIDFELIFSKYLSDFNGKIILEIPEEDNVIIDSMARIKEAARL